MGGTGDRAKAAKQQAKHAKKADKAQAKIEKKLGKQGRGAGRPAADGEPPPGGAPEHPTPAERSAAAAERQVALHRYRMWISMIAAIIALATFLATVRPWKYLGPSEPPREERTTPGDQTV